jgi:hypothetical protein
MHPNPASASPSPPALPLQPKQPAAELFEEEHDELHRELSAGNPILHDIRRHIEDPRSPGNRYLEETRRWAFDLLRTCGSKALTLVRKEFPVPSRQALSQKPPSGYARSDLTDANLIVERVRAWRSLLRGKIGSKECPRCVLARDALACKPAVEVTSRGLRGLDDSDFDFDCGLFESLLSSPTAFLDFVHTHWDRVLHAAFVVQIQPLDPDLEPFIVYAQTAADGKGRSRALAPGPEGGLRERAHYNRRPCNGRRPGV